jgi:hypothetical protein
MNNYRRPAARSTQDVAVCTDETKNEGEGRPTTNKKLEWTGYGHALSGLSGFMAAMKPDKPRRNGCIRRFSPSA